VKDRKPPLVTLYATDPVLSPKEIIEVYCQRWAIEEKFHNANGNLGLDKPQCRKTNRPTWTNASPGARMCERRAAMDCSSDSRKLIKQK
ncbi:MAG: transposase, partial [bacterium]